MPAALDSYRLSKKLLVPSNMFDTPEKVAWDIKLSKIYPHSVSYGLA